jgi:hypothetical protein
MRTRLFVRTSEFLWQEGHSAHAEQEARDSTMAALEMYRGFSETKERGRTPKSSKANHPKCSSGSASVLPAMYIHGGPRCGGNPHSPRIFTKRTREAAILEDFQNQVT